MKNPPLVTQNYYHIYNRGVEKRNIFLNRWDYLRFLETLDFYRKSPQPMKLSDYRRGVIKLKKVDNQTEIIKIFCFCLMPNHYHLLLSPVVKDGIPKFMKKINMGYAKYFNIKNDRKGTLFEARYKSILVEDESHFMY